MANSPTNYIQLTNEYLILNPGQYSVGSTTTNRSLQLTSSNLIGHGDGYLAIDNLGNITFSNGSGSSGFTAGGDLTGSSTDQQVVGLHLPATTGQYAGYDINSSGEWKAQFGNGPVYNVMDFGAKGDGVTDDTVAIQAAIDFGGILNSIVYFPAGNYLVSCTSTTAALTVTKHPVILQGAGIGASNLNQASAIVVNGLGAGLLIEDSDGYHVVKSQVKNLAFFSGEVAPEDFIVVHSPYTIIEDCYLQGNTRYTVLVESGTVGPDGNIYGVSLLPNGSYIDVDFCYVGRLYCFNAPTQYYAQTTVVGSFTQPAAFGSVSINIGSAAGMHVGAPLVILPTASVGGGAAAAAFYISAINSPTNITIQWLANKESPYMAGDSVSDASIQIGACIVFHGPDGQASIIELCSILGSPMAFFDGSLGGNYWSNNYSQGSRIGYVQGSVAPSVYMRCGSEDFTPFVGGAGNNSLIVGGALSNYTINFVDGELQVVGGNSSQLQFQQTGADGSIYGCWVPGGGATSGHSAALNFYRTTPRLISGISLAYNEIQTGLYNQNSWQFQHNQGFFFDQDWADLTGIFGFTDPGSPFGAGLFFVGSPTMNSSRHWKWKQTVSLSGGSNIVYLNGGTAGDAGKVAFCDPGFDIANDVPIGSGTNPPILRSGGVLTTGVPVSVITIGIDTPGIFPGSSPTFNYSVDGVNVASNVAIVPDIVLGGAAAGVDISFEDGYYGSDNVWTIVPLWNQAQPCMKCSLEFDTVSDMSAAQPTSINGVVRITESGGFNYAACVTVANSCAVTLVWEYDLFVPNYTTTSGNIG